MADDGATDLGTELRAARREQRRRNDLAGPRPGEHQLEVLPIDWQARDGSLWRVTFTWAIPEAGGAPFARQVAVESLESPRRRVGARILGQLPLQELERKSRQDLGATLFALAEGRVKPKKRPRVAQRIAREHLAAIQRAAPAPPKRPAQGRPRLGKEHYAQTAVVYRRALRTGENPTAAVAEWGGVKRATAASWVRRARGHGFLGPADVQGRGGEVLDEGDDS